MFEILKALLEPFFVLDSPYRSQNSYPSKSSSKNYRLYEDDRLSIDEAEEYRKILNERLLEQLMLDILKNGDETLIHQRPQKKSFFRERETNEVSENLQNLYPDDNSDENEFLVPSSFRERIKSKLHSNPHRRIVQPYETEDLDDNDDDYLNVLSPLWHKYEGTSSQDFDPETITNDDVDGFLKYLGNKEFHENDFNPELYLIEAKERDRSKRYWQGSDDSSVVKYSIQKRSAGFEQKPTTEKIVVTKTNLTQTEKVKSGLEITSAMPQKSEISEIKTSISKKGQKEVPINLKSSKPLNIKKKSIDWSEYFGVDKRQKKSNTPSKELHKNNALQDQFIQSHILQSSKNSAFNNYGKNYRYFPKRESPETQYVGDIGSKLKIAEDLKTAENLIIDHVLKYTGAHEGVTNPKELKGFREKVINELAAAYNLEKLRNELLDNSRQWFTDRTKKQHQHFGEYRIDYLSFLSVLRVIR